MFDTKSQLYFPQQLAVSSHPFWSPYFEGNVATVNGAAFPYLKVEPRRYRFHLLNGSNHRGYELSFGKAPVYQIGADDNYFDKPVPLSDVSISPGERADIIVDFSNSAGQKITVGNTGIYVANPLPMIMQFQVASRLKTPETSCDPTRPVPSIGLCARKDPLVRLTDGNGNVLPGVKIDKIRQMLFYDSTRRWRMSKNSSITRIGMVWSRPALPMIFPAMASANCHAWGRLKSGRSFTSLLCQGEHPFHIHLTQFQVVKREPLNTRSGKFLFVGMGKRIRHGRSELLPAGCSLGIVLRGLWASTGLFNS